MTSANTLRVGKKSVALLALSGRIEESLLAAVEWETPHSHRANRADIVDCGSRDSLAVCLIRAEAHQRLSVPLAFKGAAITVLTLRGSVYDFHVPTLKADAGNLMLLPGNGDTFDGSPHLAADVDDTLALMICSRERNPAPRGSPALKRVIASGRLPWLSFDPEELSQRFASAPIHLFGTPASGGAMITRLLPEQATRETWRRPGSGGECFLVLSGDVECGGEACPVGTIGFLPPAHVTRMNCTSQAPAYVLSCFPSGFELKVDPATRPNQAFLGNGPPEQAGLKSPRAR